jgi:hypothetical protein
MEAEHKVGKIIASKGKRGEFTLDEVIDIASKCYEMGVSEVKDEISVAIDNVFRKMGKDIERELLKHRIYVR